MRKAKALLFAAVVALGATASTNVLARGGWHHHSHVGVFIGAPVVFSPWYYHPYPYYYPAPAYYPAPVVYPAAPTTYVEQGQPEASSAPRADNYWYYCPGAKAYYPYVKECAGGWQRVSPQPPPS
jgi:hypothetical protein